MKVSKISKGLLLGLTLLLATSVFAANKGQLQLNDPLTINGKQLAAGEYRLQWEGAGSSVELSILRGKTVVASVPARLVDLDRPAQADLTIVRMNADGSKALSEIRFGGKKYSLAIGNESAKVDSTDGNK
ncbi:MAG TPA: hypothetical protein VMO80_12700 [Terriglobales bacterium]|jgi:hypothetical protein|nr:hypothetical protein [Terriglobales bacterium]